MVFDLVGCKNSLEEMSQKPRAPASFQSLKSLPADFRFSGLPASDRFGKSDDGNLGNSNVISSSIPENGGLGDIDVAEGIEGSPGALGDMDQVNDDSPYSGNTISIEDGPSRGDEDLDSVAPSLPSISSSHRERRWGDTTPYAVKKVFNYPIEIRTQFSSW